MVLLAGACFGFVGKFGLMGKALPGFGWLGNRRYVRLRFRRRAGDGKGDVVAKIHHMLAIRFYLLRGEYQSRAVEQGVFVRLGPRQRGFQAAGVRYPRSRGHSNEME